MAFHFLCIVYFTFSVIGTSGNIVTIYCIAKEISSTPIALIADKFLLSLTIADLLVSIIGQPMMGVYLIIGNTRYRTIIRCLFGTMIGFSLSSLCLMTAERMIKTRRSQSNYSIDRINRIQSNSIE